MSTKLFNLLGENKDIRDWQSISEPYGPSLTEKIENPDGDQSKLAPTSIPSPFARMDLVRTAFEFVNQKQKLEGNTIYHQLVSDCLDLAELFFNIDKLKGEVSIQTWDKERDLNKLITSQNPKHRLYGETLALYLEQDAATNNFDDIRRIHFIFYKNKIIGGTSPTTLFFTSGNDLSFANIENGNDIFFDDKLLPLYKREGEFQKYIHSLFKIHGELTEKMKDFYEYLDQNYRKLEGDSLYRDISEIRNENIENLSKKFNENYITVDTGMPGDNLEIIGIPLKKRKIADRKNIIADVSQFVIANTKPLKEGDFTPLVLQNKLNEALIYTDEKVVWNPHWEVPNVDETPLQQRTLPGQLDQYPYLTVSDFLQPYLVKIPYSQNDSNYFNGNVTYESGSENDSFLLPLNSTFFEYFTTEDIQKSLLDGTPMIEMKIYVNSVDVFLRIPIKGNNNVKYVTFTRTYQTSGIAGKTPDLESNKGIIIQNKISLAIHPFIKTTNSTPNYRVMFLDKDRGDTLHYTYNLAFYANDAAIDSDAIHKTTRTKKYEDVIETSFYVVKDNFDFMLLQHSHASGVIIPKFKAENGTKRLKFAVDFGTTNTHIEYKVEDEGPFPFEITPEDFQYETLHENFKGDDKADESTVDELDNINEYIRHEFFPNLIGKNYEFKFPFRTVTGESNTLDYSNTPYTLADLNIPFDYERYASKRNSDITTNLKWSDFDDDNSNNRTRVKLFIEKLVLLIRGKVLSSNGSLANTELIWFFPSSMSVIKREVLEKTWNKALKKYMGVEKTIHISESLAPFYFYKNHRNVLDSDRPVVSVDIGGGTNDIVVFKNGKPIISSSATYAANTIFGDGYGASPNINGFIQKYQHSFNDLFSKNNLNEIQRTVNQINKRNKSEDIIAFYFSLASNPTVIKNRIPIILDEILSEDGELKIVFLTFFSSIIYHTAKLMKVNKLAYPEEILFSGTGAKVIFITNGSRNLTKLNKLTTLIFSKVYEEQIPRDIELKIEDNPKEVTCKGGLEIDDTENKDFDAVRNILIGDTENSISSTSPITYNTIHNNNSILDSIVQEHNDFIDMLFSLHEALNFKNYFGINPSNFDLYIDTLKKDAMKFLKEGLTQKKVALSGDTNIKIEESLFFYPLKGSLNNLAYTIVKNAKK